MNSNSSPLSSKLLTPKKRSTRSLKSTPKKSRNTPLKNRSPRSPRTLPVSPISQSMKQSTIKDFFKPVSPSIETTESLPSSRGPLKTPKDRKDISLSPIFGSLKRNSIFNTNLNKKFRTNETINLDIVNDNANNSEFNENCLLYKTANNTNDMLDLSESNKTFYVTANDLSPKSQVMEQSSDQLFDNSTIDEKSDQNSDNALDQMMDNMKIEESLTTKVSNLQSESVQMIVESDEEFNSNHSVKNQTFGSVKVILNPEPHDKVENKKFGVSSDDEMDVPIFKVPKPVVPKTKPKVVSNKYVDKEKRNKMSYALKNLMRVNRDKQILEIEPFKENNDHNLASAISSEEPETDSSHYTKPVRGMDTFRVYIPNTIGQCCSEETKFEQLSKNLQKLCKLPLNRLSSLVPIYMTKLDKNERQFLISHIIKLVSTEERLFTFNVVERKTIKMLCSNNLGIYLSSVLTDFYQILYAISTNFTEKSTEEQIEKMSRSVSNVLKILTQILNMCSFEFEGISIEEELIKLLLIAFSLCAENKLIQNYNWSHTLQKFIAVIMKYIIFNDFNISHLVRNLLSFVNCDDGPNIGLSLHIASMIPLNVDFSLKQQFCISVLKLFTPEDISDQTYDFNLNDIQNIIEAIEWKKLPPEDIYGIIQLISLSLNFPNDLTNYKDTISRILSDLTFVVNRSVPNASNYEFSDIHQLLMILRSKIKVSL